MKNPPILIAILGFFAALAGFGFLFFGLRVVGFDWFGALGDLPAFDHVGLWGWLAIATGIVWLLAAGGLWALQPWARWFAMFMAGFALFEAALAFFQFPGTGVAFSMAILPALILWYLRSGEVKAAFGETEQPAAVAPAGGIRGADGARDARRGRRTGRGCDGGGAGAGRGASRCPSAEGRRRRGDRPSVCREARGGRHRNDGRPARGRCQALRP